MLSQADDPYLREREEDLRDLERRVLHHVTRRATQWLDQLSSPAFVVARELLPSDLLEIDRRYLSGIVTEIGGEAGQAAILARALGVPAVTGVNDAMRDLSTGPLTLVDGRTGEVV